MEFDPGLLPLDPEALASTVRMLGIAEKTRPQPTSEDTINRLLIRVGMTFHEFIAAILIDPLRSEFPHEPTLSIYAGAHAWTVADLLAVLALQPSNDTHDHSQNGRAERRGALSERWLQAIVDVCLGEEEPPWHATEASYASLAAYALSTSAQVLIEDPRLSLAPDDPCIRVRPLPDLSSGSFSEPTSKDVAVMLVWSAASALCMAAAVRPAFRLGQTSDDT
jgi:AcrR family transcriptional regulator